MLSLGKTTLRGLDNTTISKDIKKQLGYDVSPALVSYYRTQIGAKMWTVKKRPAPQGIRMGNFTISADYKVQDNKIIAYPVIYSPDGKKYAAEV